MRGDARGKWNFYWSDGDYGIEGDVRKNKSYYTLSPLYINGHFMANEGPTFQSRTQWDCVLEAIKYAYDFQPRVEGQKKKWWQFWKAESFSADEVPDTISRYYMVFVDNKNIGSYLTVEEAQEVAESKNGEVIEYIVKLSDEEREYVSKVNREFRQRQKTGEFFKDWWWKEESDRFSNADDPNLHYPTTFPEETDFFDKNILGEDDRQSKMSARGISDAYGISPQMARILVSSRVFGMYMSQQNSPATIEKYRQRILDAIDDYAPQSEKEVQMLKVLRPHMATRGVKGPSPSFWTTYRGWSYPKPELSYYYDDYYDYPVPFMGYELDKDYLVEDYGAESFGAEGGYSHQVFNTTSKAHAEKVASLVPDSIVIVNLHGIPDDSSHYFVMSKTSYDEARPYFMGWLRENDYFRTNQFLSEVKYDAESFEDFKRILVGDRAIAGDMGYMEGLEEYYEEYLEDFTGDNPESFEDFQERILREHYADEDFKRIIFGADGQPIYERKYRQIVVDDKLKNKLQTLESIIKSLNEAIQGGRFDVIETEALRRAVSEVYFARDIVMGGYWESESFHSYKVAPDLSSYTKAELVSSIAGPQGTAAYDEVVYDPIAQSRLSAETATQRFKNYGNSLSGDTVCPACGDESWDEYSDGDEWRGYCGCGYDFDAGSALPNPLLTFYEMEALKEQGKLTSDQKEYLEWRITSTLSDLDSSSHNKKYIQDELVAHGWTLDRWGNAEPPEESVSTLVGNAESIDSFSPARLMILGASIGVALGLYNTRGE